MRGKLNAGNNVLELCEHKQGCMKDIRKQSVLCYSFRDLQ